MEHDTRQHNSILYLSKAFIISFGNSLFPLSVLQSYLLGIGLGYDDLALYTTVGTVATSLVLFLLPGIADAVKRFSSFRRSLFGISIMLTATPLALLLINLFAPDMSSSSAFALILFSHALTCVFHSGLNATFDPKGVVRLGLSGNGVVRLLGLNSLLSYIACVLSSLVIPFFTGSASGKNPYIWLPALAVSITAAGSLLIFLFRPGKDDSPNTERKHISPLHVCRQIFPLPQFRLLMVPNILRAIGDSVRSFLTPIGLVLFADDPAAVGAFTIAAAVGGMLGSLLLVVLQKRVNIGRLYTFATTTIGMVLVASCVVNSLPAYVVAVALSAAGFMLYGSLPSAVTYKYVPRDVIGSFSALRLFVLNLFSSAFGYFIGVVLEWDVPFLPLSIAALAAYITSGILFQSACRKMEAAKES